jgi:hypothetical protein
MTTVVAMPVGIDLGPRAQLDVRSYLAQVQASKRANGWRDKWPVANEAARIAQDLDAFGAELGVSIVVGRPWRRTVLAHGYTRPRPPDVGNRIEVRQTRYPQGALVVQDNDPRDRIVVLATGRFPSYLVVGWILAADAASCGERDYGKLWIAQSALLPIDLIPDDA